MDSIDMDPYNEDKAERIYLKSKPTCFIIVGKPGCGKSVLAKNLSKVWKCELINGTEVVNMAIEMQTELGTKAQEILLRGEAIPEELASKLMMEKINSPEVAHHGYILDGFPSLCEDWLSLADQLELVKNLPLTPDFIINIKIPDKDLEIRRRDQKLDPLTGILYTKSEYDPEISAAKDKDVGGEDDDGGDDDELEDEEEEEEILEEEIEYPEDEERDEIGPELLARLVTKPEDLPQNITSNIKHYKEMVLRSLEDYMADHDPQKLIELDGNENQRVLFKSLMIKLNTFVLNRALIPLRLQGSEDADEIGDDTDSDDLLRTLAATEIVAPKFRWRRSRWGRNCPVSLKDGNTVLGGAQFSVSFLDKMYVMSSTEALGQFMRNPRPYLASHLPRPPCKLCVLGPPHSGKTEVAQKLAERYNAQVLVMDELIKPRREAAKKKMLEEIKDEAVQSAISKVTAIRQSMMTEKTEEEEEEEGKEKAGDEDEDDEEKEEEEPQSDAAEEGKISEEKEEEIGEEKGEEEKGEEKEESEVKSESGETKPSEDDSEPAATPAEQPRKKSKDEIPIDANHPDVIKIVNDVMAEAEKKEPDLNTDDYVEALEEAVQKRAEELLAQDPNGPSAGGYVIDDFPRSREHFSAMIERGLIPDEVVCLRDESENGEFLLKRWYATNKQELHAKWETRRAAKLEKIRAEKERLRREEEQRQAAEEARRKAEEEAKLEAGGEEGGEEGGEVGGDEGADKDATKGDEGASTTEALATEQKADDTEDTNETASPDIKVSSLSRPSDEDLGLETEEELQLDKDTPPETPETEEFRRSRTNFERDFVQLLSVVKGTNNIEPINVSVEKELETIATEVIRKVEAPFNYRAWEYTGMDQDEEEEDAEGDEEDDDDEEGGDPFNRERKKIFGDTKYYCPVLLKENNALIPGLSECAAKYRERTYFFSSVEARAKFLDDPDSFLTKDQPLKKPPTRLLIVGPKGSGKTLHGRYLAMKLGVFHISFTERLQELIIAKTKKKIGPEYEEDEDEQGSTEENVLEDIPKDLEEEEGNKEPEVELTDDEENIKSNLAYGEPLASETLDKILPAWWNQEPFRSTGFIIEGFPRNELESRYLANSGLFPDATVMLAVEDNDIVNRLLPPLLEKWKKKRDKRVAEKERLKALARQQKLELRARRREEKLEEIAARKAERQARKQARESDDSDDEAQDATEEEEDIEALMDAEFEEEEEEEDDDEEEETEEDAIERMKTEIGDRYDEEVGKLSVVQETLEELLIPRLEINAGRKPRIVRFCIEKSIQPVVEFRDCLFERCFPIDSFLANRMINNGYRFPSRFGRWCPVKLLEGEVIQPQYGGGGGLFYPCPVVYRQHIYYCCNDKTRDEFMQNPIKYLKQPSPKPVVPIRIAITGPPKSGKTALAKRFASEYGVIRLSIGEALRRVLDNQKHTELARQINIHLRSGNTVPDELAVQSLEIALLDMQCQTRGFVLDGYPLTLKQVQLMTDRKIIPVKVLELNVDDEEVLRRGMADRNDPSRTLPLHDSHQILAIRLNCWQQEVGAVRDWYCNEHRNWVALDGQRSKWWVWSEALDEARKSVRQIQVYLDRISAGKSASISNMCITHSELLSRLGDFGQYCPVSLADRGELVDCSTNPSLQLAAEFRGRYYKMGTRADLEKFLAEPARYVPPLAPRKLPDPEMLPRRRTSADVKAMFPAQIEMQGYCPVTYWDGKQRYENIVAGNPELVVEYRQKLHYFASEERLYKFMRLPELYYGLKLPHKLPPPKDPALSISSLPMLGFMEQTVSTAITKSLTAVGCFKPKYPFLDAKRSALTYVAYHLKAYNPKSSDFVRKKYKQKLMQFEEQCELIQYLGKEMTSRYRQPDERPIDFDHKLNNFLSLKGMQV